MSNSKDLKLADDKLYQGLQDLDTMLGNSTKLVETGLSNLERYKDVSLEYAQKKIDELCVQMSEKINVQLEEKKKEATKTIKEKYLTQLRVLEALKPIVDLLSMNISLDTIVTSVIKIIEALAQPYVAPYQNAIEFTQEVVTEVTPLIQSISEKSSELMAVQNTILSKVQEINPNLNVDKLNISFTPPNIQDIIG